MREEGVVQSVAEYLRLVSSLARSWREAYRDRWQLTDELEWTPWFRGECKTDLDTALQPKLYRPKLRPQAKRAQLLHEEQELRLEFKRCGFQLLRDGRPADHWDWYFLMAHCRAPTRLLDWTDSALTALYFALCDRFDGGDSHGGADAAVYMLDAWWLNDFAFQEAHPNTPNGKRPAGLALPDWPEAQRYLPPDALDTEDKIRAKQPLAIEPSHIWQRVAAQRSHFTIFGKDTDGLTSLAKRKDAKLCLIRINTRDLESLQQDLRTAGVSESLIFPDIDGLGRELSMAFGYRCAVAAQRSGVHEQLHRPTMELRKSNLDGVGVFALRDLTKGERVAEGIGYTDYERPVPWNDAKNLPRRTQNLINAFCVGTREGFIPPPDFDFDMLSVEWYFNHSCSPNLGFDQRGDFVARRNIAVGEELTYDYGLVESRPGFKMDCRCASKRCRKKITGRDWKKKGLFTTADLKFMLPWLRERLSK